jgi:hypothetical protein
MISLDAPDMEKHVLIIVNGPYQRHAMKDGGQRKFRAFIHLSTSKLFTSTIGFLSPIALRNPFRPTTSGPSLFWQFLLLAPLEQFSVGPASVSSLTSSCSSVEACRAILYWNSLCFC